MTKKTIFLSLSMLNIFFSVDGQEKTLPILDMHLHAFSTRDAEELLHVKDYKVSQSEYESLTMAELSKHNIIAYASGPHEVVKKWQASDPSRIKPGIIAMHPEELNIDSLRKWHKEGTLDVIGEIAVQYSGFVPDDPKMEPIWKLAQELDIPLALHMGIGPPNAAYAGFPKYRASNGKPLLLENILIKYPKVRVYIMHAGWPFLDEMIALLYFHHQVYVDLGIIDWGLPKNNFNQYLKSLIDAGFSDRIMFGSDQMYWPGAITTAVESIEKADFLTKEQKRDILYNNAAKFLRLSREEIAKHHGK